MMRFTRIMMMVIAAMAPLRADSSTESEFQLRSAELIPRLQGLCVSVPGGIVQFPSEQQCADGLKGIRAQLDAFQASLCSAQPARKQLFEDYCALIREWISPGAVLTMLAFESLPNLVARMHLSPLASDYVMVDNLPYQQKLFKQIFGVTRTQLAAEYGAYTVKSVARCRSAVQSQDPDVLVAYDVLVKASQGAGIPQASAEESSEEQPEKVSAVFSAMNLLREALGISEAAWEDIRTVFVELMESSRAPALPGYGCASRLGDGFKTGMSWHPALAVVVAHGDPENVIQGPVFDAVYDVETGVMYTDLPVAYIPAPLEEGMLSGRLLKDECGWLTGLEVSRLALVKPMAEGAEFVQLLKAHGDVDFYVDNVCARDTGMLGSMFAAWLSNPRIAFVSALAEQFVASWDAVPNRKIIEVALTDSQVSDVAALKNELVAANTDGVESSVA